MRYYIADLHFFHENLNTKMDKRGFANVNAMNDYMLKRVKPRYHISEYELYFYGGALLNVFMKWQENGKKESPEEIAPMIRGNLTQETHPKQRNIDKTDK